MLIETLTLHFADKLEPSVVVAVISVSPAPTKCTTPLLTVATASLLLAQSTFSSAPSGVTVAVNVTSASPTFLFNVVSESEIPVA